MGKSKSHGDTVVASSSTVDVVKSTSSEKKKSSKKSGSGSSKHKSSSRKDECASTDGDEESPVVVAPIEETGSEKKKSKKSKKESTSEEIASPVETADESAPARKVSQSPTEEAETSSAKKDKKDKKDKKRSKKDRADESGDNETEAAQATPIAAANEDDSDDEIIIHKRGADSNFNASPAKKSNSGAAGGSTPRGESTSIFVRGLMFGVTADQVKDHFADCGEVSSVRFISNDHGQCFVDFTSIEAAGLACKKDGLQGPGDTERYCNIREHTFGKWFNECAVFVEADSSVEDALREQLGQYGEIVDLQFNESGALIVFSSPNAAEAAIDGGKVNLGSNYSVWVKMAMFKEHYGLGQPRDFGNNNHNGGGRGGGRGNSRGGRGGGRGGQRGGRGGRGGNRY